MDFHPDRLLPPNAGKTARTLLWTAKYVVWIVLGNALVIGVLVVLFEPSVVGKALGGLAAIAAIVIGRWLWRGNAQRRGARSSVTPIG